MSYSNENVCMEQNLRLTHFAKMEISLRKTYFIANISIGRYFYRLSTSMGYYLTTINDKTIQKVGFKQFESITRFESIWVPNGGIVMLLNVTPSCLFVGRNNGNCVYIWFSCLVWFTFPFFGIWIISEYPEVRITGFFL